MGSVGKYRDLRTDARRRCAAGHDYTTIADVTPHQKARLEPFDGVELDVKVLFGEDPD